jgi:hypothetical protein
MKRVASLEMTSGSGRSPQYRFFRILGKSAEIRQSCGILLNPIGTTQAAV